jgi:hypothetical protein
MNNKIAYDVYRGTSDRTLRLATMPGAGLPAHVKRKEWVLMPTGKSPVCTENLSSSVVMVKSTKNGV